MPAAGANRILARLGAPRLASLGEHLTPTALRVGDVLYEAHTTIRLVYFPLTCLVSLLAPMKGHAPLEVAVVGSEGLVGVPPALGSRISGVRAVVRGAGAALSMDARFFEDEVRRQPALRARIDGYIRGLIAQLVQTAACNAFHTVEARCARSLLMARDRLRSDELDLTHEMLAQMLGVRRVGVTVAAGNLQRRGAISYSRGRVMILDRKRLSEAACECYGVIAKAY